HRERDLVERLPEAVVVVELDAVHQRLLAEREDQDARLVALAGDVAVAQDVEAEVGLLAPAVRRAHQLGGPPVAEVADVELGVRPGPLPEGGDGAGRRRRRRCEQDARQSPPYEAPHHLPSSARISRSRALKASGLSAGSALRSPRFATRAPRAPLAPAADAS